MIASGPSAPRAERGVGARRIARPQPQKARESGRPAGPAGSLHHHRTRKEAALAGLRELELATKRGESIPLPEAVARWGDIVTTAKARLLAVPSRVRQRIPYLTAADALVIDEEIRTALTELTADGTLPGG